MNSPRYRRRLALAPLALAYALAAEAVPIDSTWVGGSGPNWGTAANWTPAQVPANGGGATYNPRADDAAIVVNGSFTVDRLTLGSNGTLAVGTGHALTLAADGTNDGRIELADGDPATGNTATLNVNNVITLGGAGAIVFATPNQNRILQPATGSHGLTIGVDQTITTAAGGNGDIVLTVHNQGTIDADGGTIGLGFVTTTNDGLIRARNGGTIEADLTLIDNAGGIITIEPGSALAFNQSGIAGHTIRGGVLGGGGDVNVVGQTAQLDAGTGMHLDDVTFHVDQVRRFTLGGGTDGIDTLRANGEVFVNDATFRLADSVAAAGNNFAGLNVVNNVILEGNGTILFDSPNQNVVLMSSSGQHSLTLGSGQRVTTSAGSAGELGVNLFNEGTIDAAAGSITLGSNVRNRNLIQARDGGLLSFTSEFALDNTAGTIAIDPTSRFDLHSSLLGGTVEGGGVIQTFGNSTVFDGTSPGGLHLDGVTVAVDTLLRVTMRGNIRNDARFLVEDLNPAAGNDFTSLHVVGDVALDGHGEVLFIGPNQNAISRPSTGGHSLTIGADQRIATAANAGGEAGNGSIGVNWVNHGLIEADGGNLTFSLGGTNAGVLAANDGGALHLVQSATIENAGNLIDIEAGSHLWLSTADGGNGVVRGGTIAGGGTVGVEAASGALDGRTSGAITLDGVAAEVTGGTLSLRGTIVNNGVVRLADVAGGPASTLLIDGGVANGVVELAGTGKLEFANANTNNVTFAHGSHLLDIGAGQTVEVAAGNAGNFGVRTLNRGTLDVDGSLGFTLINTNAFENRGLIGGTGVLNMGSTGTFLNNGLVAPGDVATDGAGVLTFDRGYRQGSAGALAIGLGGVLTGAEYDQLIVTGAGTNGVMSLAGDLLVSFMNGFIPDVSDIFTIATATRSISGTFANAPGNLLATALGTFNVNYNPNSVVLSMFQRAPAGGAVPEPPLALLLTSALLLMWRFTRRRPAGADTAASAARNPRPATV